MFTTTPIYACPTCGEIVSWMAQHRECWQFERQALTLQQRAMRAFMMKRENHGRGHLDKAH